MKYPFLISLPVFCVFAHAGFAMGQETLPQPAEEAKNRAKEEKPAQDAQTPGKQPAVAAEPSETSTQTQAVKKEPESTPRYRSWEAPPVYESVVKGERPLREEDRIGDYEQPRWSATRRFPTTRIYVIPEGKMGFEYWLESKMPFEEPSDTRFRSQFEYEMGLGHRLQFDVYLTTQQEGVSNPMYLHREKLELRYALADWGVIPTNPTLYVEVARQNVPPQENNGTTEEKKAPPLAEFKLLLGDEIVPRAHWGANLVYEIEMTGKAHASEYKISGGLSYSIIDEIVSLGAEVLFSTEDESGDRFGFRKSELMAGPSLCWHPQPSLTVLIAPLFGVELARPKEGQDENKGLTLITTVIGWEF